GYGLAEVDSFVRHRVPVIAVVGNDARWSQIAREQVKLLHDDVATTLARTAYHEVARGFGAAGLEIRHAAEIAAVLREARDIARSGTPVLVNAWLEPTDFREGSISM
ncbi:MAG TPA: thiamine pyrophosphate-dependent enzyme, partial [Usitatibacter sp.]|nr:thiamine pyrophosphate-dependent enzyme [Usitatibacter sp.]